MKRWISTLATALGCLALAALPGQAQVDSTTAVAGPEYDAGLLHRFLLGAGYRDTWITPIRVPVLDLDRYGGLTPVRRGGGVQTSTLRFEAPDGREYNFRSVNKSYTHSMPEWAQGTLLQWLRKDQTAAQHPGAAIAATPLLDAAGILNPGPELFVMPDDPRLGEYREEFAGLLGTLELHPNEGEDDEILFAGSPTIAGGDRVLEHLAEEPEHRLDAPAFLAERLMSIYLGDWDRHIGQYRFARYERDGIYRWVAIPEDRDYAFVEHDGVLLAIARSALTSRLIQFDEDYPSLTAMMSNSPELVRRLLAPVDRRTWDSVTHAVHGALTDEAIENAIAALPPEWRERTGPELVETLRARRGEFLEMSDELYRLLAEQAEVHGTEEPELALIERHGDESVTVQLFAPGNERLGDRAYFERRFRPEETSEVRVFLSDGDDRAVLRGSGDGEIVLRIIGGHGDDVLLDSAGHAVLYDAHGHNRIVPGPGTRVDTKPFAPPEEGESLLPNTPRDWGSDGTLFSPDIAWKSDVGLLLGGGPAWTRYGFRHIPYASRQRLSAMVHPGTLRGDLTYRGSFRPENALRRVEALARASNVDVLRFHGFGNRSPALPDDSALTWYRRYEAAGTLHQPVGAATELAMGATVLYSEPELEEGTRLQEVRPFGVEGIGEAGLHASVAHDTRDDGRFPRRGVLASAAVAAYLPLNIDASDPVRSSREPYGNASAIVSGYLSLPLPTDPVLALRAGGVAVGGNPPIHRAAFLGGRGTLRGFSHGRFAGDATAFGTSELRVPLMAAKLVARGTLGVSAFADAGRVWLDGRSAGGWHTAVGGAAWFNTPLATVSLEVASGEERSLYLRLGMGL